MPLRRARWQPRRTRKEGNGQQWGHSRLHAADVGAQRSGDARPLYRERCYSRRTVSRWDHEVEQLQDAPAYLFHRACAHREGEVQGLQGVVEKGEARLVTHAFVRPGRSRDFVRHVGCMPPELMRAVIAAHGSVERVPTEKGMDGDALSGTCAQLCRVAVLDAD